MNMFLDHISKNYVDQKWGKTIEENSNKKYLTKTWITKEKKDKRRKYGVTNKFISL